MELDGYGSGYGYGYGYGDGSGYGSGYGVEQDADIRQRHTAQIAGLFPVERILSVDNIEYRRELLTAAGPDHLFSSGATIVHADVDNQGNPRQLLRLPLADAEVGYIQAVRVVCPTTLRVYHLLVPHTVETCADAVASTFKIAGYMPIRET